MAEIPKVAWFYWGEARTMSWLRYLTFVSFKKTNPDIRIILCEPKTVSKNIPWHNAPQKELTAKYTGPSYLDKARQIADEVEIIDFKSVGFSNEANEVHKSDYLRLWLLGHRGGYWFDTDIFFLRPVKIVDQSFACRYTNSPIVQNAVMGAVLNCPIFLRLQQRILRQVELKNYEALGPRRVTQLLRNNVPETFYKNEKLFFPYRCSVLYRLYDEEINPTIPNETIGIHWYGGMSYSEIAEATYTQESVQTKNSLLAKLCRELVQ